MPKYKATKKFKELGIENSYQHLEAPDFEDLWNGKIVTCELNNRNQYLIDNKYVEKLKEN